MVSEMSASASNQFLETSNTSQAMNSSLRSRITSATRNKSDARSSTEVRLQWVKACNAAYTAGSTCSLPAFWCTPTTSDGLAGLMERILSEVLRRLPPMIRSYSRPSWPRTFSMAVRILRTFSSLVKSTNGSFLNGPSCRRTCRRGGASMVAIGDPFQDGTLVLARIFATYDFTPAQGSSQAANTNPRARSSCVLKARASLAAHAISLVHTISQEILFWSAPGFVPPPPPPHPPPPPPIQKH